MGSLQIRYIIQALIVESALLESFSNHGLMGYLEDLADKASGGDLKGAVKGLLIGSHAKEARLFVFQQCQIINWRAYPTLSQCGVERLIPSKMPGMWGLAKTGASLTSWLLKNKDKPRFREELSEVVEESLSSRSIAA